MKRSKQTIAAIMAAIVLSGTGATIALRAQTTAVSPPPANAPTVDHTEALNHYRDAKAFFEQQKWADADKEVTLALQNDPDMPEAKLLKLRVAGHLKEATTGASTGPAPKTELLTPEQISRIRLQEITKTDSVRGSIPRKTLQEFWANVVLKDETLSDSDKTRDKQDAFLNPGNVAGQIRLIRAEKADKYYDQIKIESDPAVMATFRKSVQPFILQNCATVGCHTGNDAHGYRIYGTAAGTNDAQTYTNFYQMTTYSKGSALMLDRQTPENSLFLQYSLNVRDAASPHPGGKDVVRTKFGGQTDVRFVEMVGWIKQLSFPAPDYGVKWKPADAPKK